MKSLIEKTHILSFTSDFEHSFLILLISSLWIVCPYISLCFILRYWRAFLFLFFKLHLSLFLYIYIYLVINTFIQERLPQDREELKIYLQYSKPIQGGELELGFLKVCTLSDPALKNASELDMKNKKVIHHEKQQEVDTTNSRIKFCKNFK